MIRFTSAQNSIIRIAIRHINSIFTQAITPTSWRIKTFALGQIQLRIAKIHNIDNLEYAKQLEQQFQELNNQKDQLESEKNEEVEILADATARKIQLEQQYSKVYEESIKNQKKGLDELIAKTQELINKRREYLSMWWWSSHNAYWWSVLSWHTSIVGENGPEQIIARQSSYVQPRNASNSYSTVNNDNSFSINWINVNVSNIDEFLDELKQKMTYRN